MDYELYHDESHFDGFWHGMLLVPTNKKSLLLSYLDTIRHNTNYFASISLKNIKKKNRKFSCASAWVQIGVGFLRSREKQVRYPIFFGKLERGRRVYSFLPPECVGVKFILFKEQDDLNKLSGHIDYASKVETTFRMGFKGGLHFLGSFESPIHITKIHFDGYEHLKRHIDKKRIIDRITGLREYCSIDNKPALIDDRSSNPKKENSQPYEDCQLLQLTDLLIGSSRVSLGYTNSNLHRELARPVKQIMTRYQKGYARMRNSRWWNSFVMSQCYLEQKTWQFDTLEYFGKKEYNPALS